MSNYAIVPAYNEEKNIFPVLEKIKIYIDHIIVVDDGSIDSTSQLARKAGVTVLKHKINLGKGAALKTGCDYAVECGAVNLVAIDGDGQHDPKEIPLFLEALKEKDIVFSYRSENEVMPPVLKFGNYFINKVLRTIFRVNVQDSQCGYRAFTSEAYKKIRWDSTDYFMETEMIINVGKERLKHQELPIATIYTDRYKGTTVIDGVKIVLKTCTKGLFK
jgi:glycosyltransferase involved in cell wall biosynthesis